MVRDRREYDEPTVLNWIASDEAQSSSGRSGYPTLLGGAAISGSAVEQVHIYMYARPRVLSSLR